MTARLHRLGNGLTVAIDPMPRRLPYGARMLTVLVTVPFHAFIDIAPLSADSPVAPETYPSLADQHRAAGLLWASGELFGLATLYSPGPQCDG